MSFTITYPARNTATTSKRKRNYISPSIASLSIAIDGLTPAVFNAPALTGSPQTVTETVAAPPGNDTFAIEEYDAANATGNELGKVSMNATVVEDQSNVIYLTVDGELAKIAIEPVVSPFLEGSLAAGYTLVGYQPQTFMAVPQDADGNTIVSPGAIPGITVASGMPAAIVATQGANTNTFTLQAPAPTPNVTITAMGTNLEGAPVTSAFNADALAAFYIADYLDEKIRVFDENGTPIALPTGAFAGVTNPNGLAFVPGGNGSVFLTETSNFQQPLVASFDLNGNPLALAPQSFAGLDQPLYLGYGNGKLFVPNYYNSTVSIFDTSGNAATAPTAAFSALTLPVASLYDPDDNELYVTNLGNNTINAYNVTTGAMLATATTGSKPMGIAYDPSARTLYVAFAGTLGGALNAPSVETPTPGGVDEFNAADLSAVTNTGGFLVVSPESYFTGIAFDPYTKLVYAADAGMSKIDVYNEAGTAQTPSGGFTTISASNAPASEPQSILFVP